MKLILVSCCGKKLSHPAPAKVLYTSDLFKKSRAYAESQGDIWAILSAKLGLVMPDEVIAPYDMTLTTQKRDLKEAWSYKVLESIRTLDQPITEIEVLAGRDYIGWVDESPYPVRLPLSGMGIGSRLQFLKAFDSKASQLTLI